MKSKRCPGNKFIKMFEPFFILFSSASSLNTNDSKFRQEKKWNGRIKINDTCRSELVNHIATASLQRTPSGRGWGWFFLTASNCEGLSKFYGQTLIKKKIKLKPAQMLDLTKGETLFFSVLLEFLSPWKFLMMNKHLERRTSHNT